VGKTFGTVCLFVCLSVLHVPDIRQEIGFLEFAGYRMVNGTNSQLLLVFVTEYEWSSERKLRNSDPFISGGMTARAYTTLTTGDTSVDHVWSVLVSASARGLIGCRRDVTR